ncbi:helix-turn-helix domain-containing protein [Curtobacterium sp. VKM Ac-1376]|uniref:helix-turn-helix domain-containing protein n=1 Tax=Curtobacterium sp. VKM Ac-1376 TaxID=123312 RepID=UPI00188B4C3E|nr:helix-turn-helix domain-containing protein [Curtobacterium sp. VKM Ac-1376]
MALALHHSNAKGTAKIVLLGIANHDGDGGAWPAVSTLALYANVDERSVQRSIDALVAAGEVARDYQAGGMRDMADHRRPNLYRLRLSCPPNCDGTTAHRVICTHCGKPLKARERRLRLLNHRTTECAPKRVAFTSPGDASVTPRVTPVSPPPGDASVTQTVLREPPVEPSTPQVLTRPQTARAIGNDCGGSRSGRHDFHPVTGHCRNACGERQDIA